MAAHDALVAAEWVASRCDGVTLEQFTEDDVLRLAVERQLEIAGEALARAERADPDFTQMVPDLRRVIGLRSVLAHGYDVIDPHAIHLVATISVPALAVALRQLLGMEDTE